MSNIHDEAAAVLDEVGWLQNAAKNAEGNRCLLACYEKALVDRGLNSDARLGLWHLISREFTEANAIDVKVDHEEYRHALESTEMIRWNDTDGRVVDEVLHALKRASELHDLAGEGK